MKKWIAASLMLILLAESITSCAFATDDPVSPDKPVICMKVNHSIMTVDGVEKEIDPGTETAPVMIEGRTFLPVRAIMEELGGCVSWNASSKTVLLTYGKDTITLAIGGRTAYFNDRAEILEVSPVIISGRTMLPIRFIMERFGFQVEWNEEEQEVMIFKETEPEAAPTQAGHEADMTIQIDDKVFFATLYDNETAAAFRAMLPLTLTMSELNGNEKYDYLADTLPANAKKAGTINAGDIMLYGANCVVLFYETFTTSYSYTNIGHIEDVTGLRDAVGVGSVTVVFKDGN